jgi:hypothetical protein
VKDDIDELNQALEQTRISSAKPLTPPNPSAKSHEEMAAEFLPEGSAQDVSRFFGGLDFNP